MIEDKLNLRLPYGRELTPGRFATGWIIYYNELLSRITTGTLFRATVYSILATIENYKKQMMIYNELISGGYDMPHKVTSDREGVEEILRRSMHTKAERIIKLAEQVQDEGFTLFSDIIADTEDNNRGNGRELRRSFVELVEGVGWKTASLILNRAGYQFMPIDIWNLRLLEAMGCNVNSHLIHGKKQRGIKEEEEYSRYESVLIKLADVYGIPPALMHATLWGMYAKIDARQGVLAVTPPLESRVRREARLLKKAAEFYDRNVRPRMLLLGLDA